VLNVLVNGQRYRNVTKEVKDYVHGLYGKSPAPVSDEIRKLIIGDDKVITVRPADLLEPAYEKMKEEAEKAGLVKKEEDILTYILYPAIAPSFLKNERSTEEIPKKQSVSKPSSEMPSQMEVEVDGEVFSVRIISVGGSKVEVESVAPHKIPRGDFAGGIKSNIQGMVLKVLVNRGASVKKGDTLLVLEAMKMENPIHSPVDGKVIEIFVDTGDVVQNGDVLLVVQ
jgi:pyruvate carboxylase subunit B